MAGEKFLQYDGSGVVEEVEGVQAGGGPSAGRLVALDNTGRLDPSMLPSGMGADVAVIDASESLSAGDFVNIHDSGSGAFGVRKADASNAAKRAHAFVLDNVSANNPATVYFEGTNTAVTGQSPGDVYLSTTAGKATSTPPSGSGDIVQRVGVAISATEINFESGSVIKLA